MLRPPNHFGEPIRNLQFMLRTISLEYPFLPQLLPDGIFGERTLEAVMLFQRTFHPPVTGNVDNDTWDAIVSLFQQVQCHLPHPRPCTGYPSHSYTIKPGDHCVHLYLIQSMFKALTYVLDEVEDGPVNGIHEGASVRNTQWVQRAGMLEPNGIMDKATWDTLSRLYTIFVTFAQTPWLTRPEVLNSERPSN